MIPGRKKLTTVFLEHHVGRIVAQIRVGAFNTIIVSLEDMTEPMAKRWDERLVSRWTVGFIVLVLSMFIVDFLYDIIVSWTPVPPILNTWFISGISIMITVVVFTVHFWRR